MSMTTEPRESWFSRLRARDVSGSMPFFGFTNVFWVFAFLGNDLHGWRLAFEVVIAVAASVMFTLIPVVTTSRPADRLGWFVAYLVPYAMLWRLIGANTLYLGTYVGMAAATLLPVAASVPIGVLVGGSMIAMGWHWSDSVLLVLGAMALFMAVMMSFSIQNGRRKRALEDAQRRNAVLAVAAERARIGRDLHDILGHSLTAIAVKGDLAARLVDRNPEAAKAQLEELVAVARQALADTRATASGLREVRVATEVASARSVLESAGVAADTPSAMPALDDATSELFGYVVREGVTNVVRHAGATRCRIAVSEDAVSVSDDGLGPQGGSHAAGAASSGVRGLSARAADLGFGVRLAREDDRTVLTCTRTIPTAEGDAA